MSEDLVQKALLFGHKDEVVCGKTGGYKGRKEKEDKIRLEKH